MTVTRAEDGTAGRPGGPSRLRVRIHAAASPERAAQVLGRARETWLGERLDGEGDRYLVDLELRVREEAPRVAFRKAAFVEVGALQERDDALSVRISWRAAGLTPLFPIFAGRLSWSDDELRLDGYYEPPGGNVGIVMDRLLLNVAARATGRRMLERIAEVLAGD